MIAHWIRQVGQKSHLDSSWSHKQWTGTEWKATAPSPPSLIPQVHNLDWSLWALIFKPRDLWIIRLRYQLLSKTQHIQHTKLCSIMWVYSCSQGMIHLNDRFRSIQTILFLPRFPHLLLGLQVMALVSHLRKVSPRHPRKDHKSRIANVSHIRKPCPAVQIGSESGLESTQVDQPHAQLNPYTASPTVNISILVYCTRMIDEHLCRTGPHWTERTCCRGELIT